MTEAEWLTATDPNPMLDAVGDGSFRKLKLVACESCRIMWKILDEQEKSQFELAETDEDAFWTGADVGIILIRNLERTESHPAIIKIIRDIFGNPFRPVIFNPSWLSPTVLTLANGIYEEKAFDRMPILADVLQNGGCDNADILNHCRGDGPHVRGCFVVDLLTGRK